MFLFACMAMFCTACAGMSAAETGGAIAAGTGVLTALADAIIPYLPADKQALVVERMTQAQTVLEAVTTAMGSVAQTAANAAERSQEGLTAGEVTAGGGILTGAAVGISRALSVAKHGKAGKMQAS